MSLIGNGIKSKTAGKSGLNDRIYQPFYGISRKHAEINTEKVSLSTGPKFHTPAFILFSSKSLLIMKFTMFIPLLLYHPSPEFAAL